MGAPGGAALAGLLLLLLAGRGGFHAFSSVATAGGAAGSLSLPEVLSFERRGHLALRQFFAPEDVASLKAELLRTMETTREEAKLHAIMMNDAEVEELAPFLQHFNPWRRSEKVAEFARSPRLAEAACRLLNVESVRLYQDCVFEKRVGDDCTNWHSDLTMAPLDTNEFLTFWIPLDYVLHPDDGGTGLHFVDRSHRDFALSFWHGDKIRGDDAGDFDLSERYEERVEHHGDMQVGDLTVHHGWCLHFAPENEVEERLAYTVSFVADGARLLPKGVANAPDNEDAPSYEDWVKELEPGALVDHDLVPVVPRERK